MTEEARPGDFLCCNCGEDITFSQAPVFDPDGDGYCDGECFMEEMAERQADGRAMPWDEEEEDGS